MTHQDRKDLHGSILLWYDNHPDSSEEYGTLGSHAIAVENHELAYYYFELGLKNTLFTNKGEDNSERYVL